MSTILIGALLGLLSGGPFGAVIGAVIGSWISKRGTPSLGGFGTHSSEERRQQTQNAFFRATFLVMGRVAKADGRVSENEINAARSIMNTLRLTEAQRRLAIELFNEGKNATTDIDSALRDFRRAPGARTLMPMFIEIQLSAAYADGALSAAELQLFNRICEMLDISAEAFNQIHRRFRAQQDYHRSQHSYQQRSNGSQQGQQRASGFGKTPVQMAYDVLGVKSSASDSDVKKAWRKLMSENHPDKLVAKGLPEEMMEVAKQKTQEIQAAYDLIRDVRKGR